MTETRPVVSTPQRLTIVLRPQQHEAEQIVFRYRTRTRAEPKCNEY
jgi:hypothetical protein